MYTECLSIVVNFSRILPLQFLFKLRWLFCQNPKKKKKSRVYYLVYYTFEINLVLFLNRPETYERLEALATCRILAER